MAREVLEIEARAISKLIDRLDHHFADAVDLIHDCRGRVKGVPVMDGVREISRGRMGMTAVVDETDRIVGIFTDGDLRRCLERGENLDKVPIAEVMTRTPRILAPDKLAIEAVELMERCQINQVLVADGEQKLVGALNMHDLFRARVI